MEQPSVKLLGGAGSIGFGFVSEVITVSSLQICWTRLRVEPCQPAILTRTTLQRPRTRRAAEAVAELIV
ncbi:MAG: hypothetical protein ABIL68_10945 [bacterium]